MPIAQGILDLLTTVRDKIADGTYKYEQNDWTMCIIGLMYFEKTGRRLTHWEATSIQGLRDESFPVNGFANWLDQTFGCCPDYKPYYDTQASFVKALADCEYWPVKFYEEYDRLCELDCNREKDDDTTWSNQLTALGIRRINHYLELGE